MISKEVSTYPLVSSKRLLKRALKSLGFLKYSSLGYP